MIDGQEDKFRALYDANHSWVRRFLARIAGPQDADDLAQVVFTKAAAALPDFRGAARPSTWLYRIAANVASDWLRSRSAHEAQLTIPLLDRPDDELDRSSVGVQTADSRPSPEQELSRKQMHECIRREIGKLPETLRTVLMLSTLGGLSDDEIAARLGISYDNTKVRLHRARHAFKRLIEARCDFYRNELSCKPTSASCCAPAESPAKPAQGSA